MTFEEALKELKNRKKIRRKDWIKNECLAIENGAMVKECNGTKTYTMCSILCCSLLADDWEIYQEPILDEEERKYLSAVIRPFRDKVLYIKKSRCADGEYIFIELKVEIINLPLFEKDTMYKGMEVNKDYTLKELGL